ncbi:unnamed protein product [Camellia sinensis]
MLEGVDRLNIPSSVAELYTSDTLDIVAENPEKFTILALATGSNVTLLADQIVVRNESLVDELKEALADVEDKLEFIASEQGAIEQGLEVFASDFANDVPFAYNFSYNPVAEYLSFIDNGNFSVDGVLSNFPITPSAAIACFSHRGRNVSGQET